MRAGIVTVLVLMLGAPSAEAERRRPVERPSPGPSFERIEIVGWDRDAMEPFISPDGQILLFNNSNDPGVNTDLHWARRQSDTVWIHQGPVLGVNTDDLEAVPSIDQDGYLYFVSTRTYQLTLSTIYRGRFENGVVTNLQLLDEISRRQPGWVNFDAAITRDGDRLYFVDARFSPLGFPLTADLVIALNLGNRFSRQVNSNDIMNNVNTAALEYAAAISPDELTLWFTRALDATSVPGIWKTTRGAKDQPWDVPAPVATPPGFVEAPALSEDGSFIYYHRRVDDRFVIERIPARSN